jgi:hypothetical protein
MSQHQQIIINPELIPNVLSNGEHEIFALWNILKIFTSNNNSFIDYSAALIIAQKYLSLSPTYSYQKINKGVDLYWTKPFISKGVKKMSLFSINNVIKRLQPRITRCCPVCIPFEVFNERNSKFYKELFISIFASRHIDERPISLETICKVTNQSESTVRNAIKNCEFIHKKLNFEIISRGYTKDSLVEIIKSSDNPYGMRLVQSSGKYSLVKQIGNSYVLDTFHRIPLRHRPEALKKIDKLLLDVLVEKKYTAKESVFYKDKNQIISYTL